VPRELSLLTEEVKTALADCDDGLRGRAVSMARSLHDQLPARVPSDAIAVAIRKALVRDGLPAIGNAFAYAKETALRMAGDDQENRLEAAEGNERRPPKDHVRSTGWNRPAMIVGAPERKGLDVEADEFLAEMEKALSRLPDYLIARVQGDKPVPESAKERILDAVALLYRSRGQAAGDFFSANGTTYALCIRRADAEWTRQRMWDWYGHVRVHVDAMRAGAAYVPEIPNASRYLGQALMAYRKEYGAEQVEGAPAGAFAV
jgi:hypothetical protein